MKLLKWLFGIKTKDEIAKSNITKGEKTKPTKCICCDNDATIGIYCINHYITQQ